MDEPAAVTTAPPRLQRRLVALVASVVVLGLAVWVIVIAVSSETPTNAQVAGVWQRGDSHTRITIYPSGNLTFSDIPKGVVDWGQGDHEEKTKIITISGTWSPFWNYGLWGGVSSGYDLSDGQGGPLISQGNELTGRRLIMYFGDDEQYEYDFHRISPTS
jgi:hypothetical protein